MRNKKPPFATPLLNVLIITKATMASELNIIITSNYIRNYKTILGIRGLGLLSNAPFLRLTHTHTRRTRGVLEGVSQGEGVNTNIAEVNAVWGWEAGLSSGIWLYLVNKENEGGGVSCGVGEGGGRDVVFC
ncbi:hypothetical protein TNCT_700981 [Trichonephila clavata]|uniref:Uncharacterized protein n=1 Tax=Trichonephila clavata TaxID=2740835 RepID=A0A8X6G8I8_TRICU|nr:hypothetical protein TNCT_700981 [Trichonephila clavata]